MKILFRGTEKSVSILTYQAIYDSGIEWKNVGGVFKSIDRGINTAKWSSDITIRGINTEVSYIREFLRLAAISGETFQLYLNPYETVFGPEFYYNYVYPFTCYVDASEEPYKTGNMNEHIPVEWTFTVYPIGNMFDNHLYPTEIDLPTDLYVQNIDRSNGLAGSFLETETSRKTIGFLHNAYTTDVKYVGSKEVCAKAKAFLTRLRGNVFTLTTYNYWIFQYASRSPSNSVHVISIEDDGPMDKAGIDHSFTVTYGVSQ